MSSMPRIDLNCDMGESFGAYEMGHDEAVLDHVSSANIACGFHAGDPRTMHRTVKMALDRGVAIGAHPGLPDLQGFGRRNMTLSRAEAYDCVIYQVGALSGFAQALGGKLTTPALGSDWEWHTFRTDGGAPADPNDFIRLKVEEVP